MGLEDVMRQAIEKTAAGVMIQQVIIGTAVNVTDTKCDVDRDGATTLYDVSLNAFDDNLQSYVTIVPKVNSAVIVARIDGRKQEGVVIRCSEVEKVLWKCGDMQLEFKGNEILINGGNNGGLVKVNHLSANLNTITAYANALKQAVTAALTTLDSASVAGTGYTAAFNGAMASFNLNMQNMENIKVKH